MDKRDWSWLPAAMPGVAKLVAERRREFGNKHVSDCWARGMAGEPGFFFAREGPLAIGTPWDDPALANFAALAITTKQVLLVIKQPEVSDGAHS